MEHVKHMKNCEKHHCCALARCVPHGPLRAPQNLQSTIAPLASNAASSRESNTSTCRGQAATLRPAGSPSRQEWRGRFRRAKALSTSSRISTSHLTRRPAHLPYQPPSCGERRMFCRLHAIPISVGWCPLSLVTRSRGPVLNFPYFSRPVV